MISTPYLQPNLGLRLYWWGYDWDPGMWGNVLGCFGLDLVNDWWAKGEITHQDAWKLTEGSSYIAGSHWARGKKSTLEPNVEVPSPLMLRGTQPMLPTKQSNIVWASQLEMFLGSSVSISKWYKGGYVWSWDTMNLLPALLPNVVWSIIGGIPFSGQAVCLKNPNS